MRWLSARVQARLAKLRQKWLAKWLPWKDTAVHLDIVGL